MADVNTRLAKLLKDAASIHSEFEPSVVSEASIGSELSKRATEQNQFNMRNKRAAQEEI